VRLAFLCQTYFQLEKNEVFMIAVNQLIQDAYESIGMTGLGEAVGTYDSTDDYGDGNMSVVACKELNRLITQLNNQGYIAMAQKFVDVPCAKVIHFRKLQAGEIRDDVTVDMEPPEKIEAVARKVGDRYIVLTNNNAVQMAGKNPFTIAMTWTYDTEIETVPSELEQRVVGILTLDGDPRNSVRVWYNSKLPQYKLDDTIFLSDLYNELLMSGLCLRLAKYFELSEEKKADLNRDFTSAKTLIKRNNITQRMLQNSKLMGDYRDAYFNGLNGVGM